jgi:hypothetical protein
LSEEIAAILSRIPDNTIQKVAKFRRIQERTANNERSILGCSLVGCDAI